MYHPLTIHISEKEDNKKENEEKGVEPKIGHNLKEGTAQPNQRNVNINLEEKGFMDILIWLY